MAKSIIKVFLIAAMLMVSVAHSLPAWAQSAELDAAFKQYQALKRQGKYAEATPFAQTFLEIAKKEFGATHRHYANGLNNLAELKPPNRAEWARFRSMRTHATFSVVAVCHLVTLH